MSTTESTTATTTTTAAETPPRVNLRALAIEIRKQFAGSLRRHGVTDGPDYSYCTNAIYHGIFGRSAREKLAKLELSAGSNLRDHLDPTDLAAVELAERLASERMEAGSCEGVSACHEVCKAVGEAVGRLMDGVRSGYETP